jgi:superfamily II DNA/RNA helicase
MNNQNLKQDLELLDSVMKDIEKKLKKKDKRKEWQKEYDLKRKDKRKEYYLENKDKNKEHKKEYDKQYNLKNRDSIKEKNKEYRLENKEVLKEYNREYERNRKKIDPIFKLKKQIRTLICQSFKIRGFKKNSKTFSIIGCSFEEFREKFQSKFNQYMTWPHFMAGLIHIDHIIPLSTANTIEEVIQLNHYTNLQPLWATTEIARANGDLISIGNLEKSDN